jgi:hypothetical protein
VPDAEGLARPLSIPEDVPVIREGIRRVGAALVVVDPIMAFLSGKTDSYRDQDVRRVLAALSALARRPAPPSSSSGTSTSRAARTRSTAGGGSIG